MNFIQVPLCFAGPPGSDPQSMKHARVTKPWVYPLLSFSGARFAAHRARYNYAGARNL